MNANTVPATFKTLLTRSLAPRRPGVPHAVRAARDMATTSAPPPLVPNLGPKNPLSAQTLMTSPSPSPSTTTKLGSSHLTLQHFIVRGQVLSLYRSYLRQLRPLADPATKRDMRSWIRGEFERTRWESDIEKIKSHLSEGRAQLKRVAALVGLGTA